MDLLLIKDEFHSNIHYYLQNFAISNHFLVEYRNAQHCPFQYQLAQENYIIWRAV
jgi:hypothetical protein